MDNKIKTLKSSYKDFYDEGMKMLQRKNLVAASKNLIEALSILNEISKITYGEEREKNLEQANLIIGYINQIKSSINKTKKSNTVKSGDKLTKIEQIDNDESDPEKTKKSKGISFDDVAGLDDVKVEITKMIINPIKYPDVYERFKIEQGGGILLYGVPGTGKTMIAKAIANEIDAEFFSIKSSDITSKYFGESENNIKKLFEDASKHDRSIIFFDEFDAIGGTRDSDSEASNRVVNELLAQIQGFEERTNVLVLIAATNRPWDIDSGLLRPGRFNRLIEVPLPDYEARRKILELKMKDVDLVANFDYDFIAQKTEGFNSSDINEFTQQLKFLALNRSIEASDEDDIVIHPISNEDTLEVFKTFKTSVDQNDIDKITKFNNSRK